MAAVLGSSSSSSSRHPIPFSLSDLSQPDINLLTQILSQPPTPAPSSSHPPTTTHNALQALIRALPPHLRAPIPHQRTIASLFPRTTHLPPCARLCALHKPLNAQLIHTILTTLTTELDHHLSFLTRPTLAPLLTPSQALLLPRLRALHALWLAPAVFRARFASDPDPQWRFQADGCEACMLARVGGDNAVLVALRTVLVSRRRKGRPKPRLLRWVDGWMEAVGGQEGERVRVEGGVDGRALRHVRRAARRGRGEGGGEDVERSELEGEGEDDGFENEIIDLYASRSSSMMDLPLPRAEGARRLGELPTDRAGWSDSSSWQSGRWSGPSSLESRTTRVQGVGEAEMRADEYRALLGSRASSDRPEGERRSGSTTWSTFLRR